MSTGMRRVRKVTQTTSKTAPQLFSSTGRKHVRTAQRGSNADGDEDTDMEKEGNKKLSRNLKSKATTISPVESREVSIHMPDPFDEEVDPFVLPPSHLTPPSPPPSTILSYRDSIEEIRKQTKYTTMLKRMIYATIGFILLRSISSRTFKENDPQPEMIVSKVERGGMDSSNEKSSSHQIEVRTNEIDDISISDNIRETEETIRKKIKSKKSTDEKTKKTSSENKNNSGVKYAKVEQDEKPRLSGGIKSTFVVRSIPDIPDSLESFADVSSSPSGAKGDFPFYWDIHLGGGTIIEHIFGKCLNFTQASEIGVQKTDQKKGVEIDKSLRVVDVSGSKYLNVDTTSTEGLDRAKSFDILKSPNAPRVIYSPMIHELSSLFTSDNRGRMFTLFRHPIERSVGMYYYLMEATSDPLHSTKLKKMSILDYAASPSIENNWMTRFLVNKKGGRLNEDDLISAKEILRKKCLVGLFENIEESLIRFEKYFGWYNNLSFDEKICQKTVIKKGDKRHNHQVVDEGGRAWKALLKHNAFDMALYEYAKILYKEQESLFQ